RRPSPGSPRRPRLTFPRTRTQGSGRPPDLPPFPPRRSSDLPFREAADGRDHARHPGAGRDRFTPRRRLPPARGAEPAVGSARRRSEEHTSELQSRENLVCRLLLEKKTMTKLQTAPIDELIAR